VFVGRSLSFDQSIVGRTLLQRGDFPFPGGRGTLRCVMVEEEFRIQE
jgi:hypothetical protein